MDQNVANYYNTIQDNIRKSIKDNLEKAKALPVGTVRNWGGKLYKKDNTNNWNFIGYADEKKKEKKTEGYEGRPDKLKEIEDKIKGQKFESLYAINDDGRVDVEKDGSDHSVQLTKKEGRELNRKIVTHNHPGVISRPNSVKNTVSFSKPDIMLACGNNVEEIRAVGNDGYIYSLKEGEFEEWGTQGGVEMIERNYRMAKNVVRGRFQNKINEKVEKYGEDSEEAQEAVIEAQTNDPHEAMKIVAENLKLEYKVYKNK